MFITTNYIYHSNMLKNQNLVNSAENINLNLKNNNRPNNKISNINNRKKTNFNNFNDILQETIKKYDQYKKSIR